MIDELPPDVRPVAKKALRIYLYRSSVEAWSRLALGVTLDKWQRQLVEVGPGKRAICLVHRQSGKTTAAAIATSHHLMFGGYPSTSLVLSPTQRQSAEFVRRARGFLVKAGAKLTADNAFSIQLENGARLLGLPGENDASIRGLSIDGMLIVDEAARVQDALVEAAQPMLLRHMKKARFFMLSTAWAKSGVFHRIWSEGDPKDWIKIEATIEQCGHLTPADIERERRSMPAAVFAREYLNQFDSLETRFFNPESINRMFGLDNVLVPEVTLQTNNDEVVSRQAAFKNTFGEAVWWTFQQIPRIGPGAQRRLPSSG